MKVKQGFRGQFTQLYSSRAISVLCEYSSTHQVLITSIRVAFFIYFVMICLLSVPSNFFLKVLVNRITTSLDHILRKEQAGFRSNIGCIDHIFTIRNIIEQSIEWQHKIILNFIDFEKAFDSLNRECMWEILKAYGLPSKLINIIKMFYDKYRCAVLHQGQQTDWFPVKSGVRQGCVSSPLLFLIVINWCMRTSIGNGNTGIRWTLNTML